MSNRYEGINNYLNKGVIEANMEYAKENDAPLCVAKFGYEVDLEDGYFFKSLIGFIHAEIGFNPVIQHLDNTFLLLLRDTKIHSAKALLKKIEASVKQKFKLDCHAFTYLRYC